VSKALLSSSNLVQTLEGTGQVSDQNQGIIRTFLLLSAAVGGQTVEAPFGLLWMAGAKYYGTGRQFLVKATTLEKAFMGLETLIKKMSH
jgi:hypothetical protein